MKLKEVFYMIGLKPKPRRYGYEIRQFELEEYGLVKYAQWLHPSESEKVIKVDVIRELRSFLNRGDFCIDIGAHTGDTTIPISLAVGKKGCVLALEPNEYVYPLLEKNSKLNVEKTNIIPLMVAAASQDGDLEFGYSDCGFCNGGLFEGISKWKHGHVFKLKVRGINLSYKLRQDYSKWLEKLKFVKIDVEGYDLSVIKSISDIIEEFSPFVETEVYKNTTLEYRKEMYEFFNSKGYSIYKVNADNHLKGFKIVEKDLMKWKHYDIFCIPRS